MTCDNHTDFAYTDMPFAMKLFRQELMSVGVQTRVL